jgi:hypothetical protein
MHVFIWLDKKNMQIYNIVYTRRKREQILRWVYTRTNFVKVLIILKHNNIL